MSHSLTTRHTLMAVFACVLWSSAFVSGKAALEHQTPLNLAGTRFLLAGLMQIPLCGSVLAPFRLWRAEFKTVLIVSLFHTVYLYSTFFIGLNLAPGAEGAIMIGVGPLASALMAHVLTHDDKMQRQTMAGILLGMVGVVMISLARKPWSPVGHKEFVGLMLLLSGAFISGIGNVVVAKRKGGLHPIALNSAQMMLGGVVLLALAFPFEGAPRLALPATYYGHLFWLATISSPAFAIWFYLLGKIKVSKLNLWKFLVPVVGATLSWIFLPGESPTAASLVGMVFIAAGIVVGQREQKNPSKRESAVR